MHDVCGGCAAADLEQLLTAPPLQSLALSPQIMFSGLRTRGVAGKEVKKCVQTERELPQINSSTNIHGVRQELAKG